MKTYACPFCNTKLHRDELVKHIEKYHDDEVPHNMTPYHLVYDIVNGRKGHGICTVCGKDTPWNEDRQKYARLCGDPKCYEEVKKTYQKRMLKVYNKIYLTDDPKHQEKMLAGRRISNQYKWSDGKIFTYTGSYEKQLLEFLDKVMNYKSDEIITPGPVLEYKYKGQTHHWITDCIILPYNLIIEVKDGGDNPNNRFMPEYRAKQVAKEKMITNLGKYHYLRLTNNNFGQLLSIIAELKMQVVDDNTDNKLYRINEDFSDMYYRDPFFQEASRINDHTFVAKEEFNKHFAYIPNIFLKESYGLFYDTSRENELISSFACIYPSCDLINRRIVDTFTSVIEHVTEYLKSLEQYTMCPYKGFYLDQDQPINGYLVGIEVE